MAKLSLSRTNEGERLSKRVMQLRGCSRREAEQYIEGGWVTVDGRVVETPQTRVLAQQVALSPDASLLAMTPVTLVFNKPAGTVSAQAPVLLTVASHSPGDTSDTRVLQRHLQQQASPVALETGASGLLVFSQDWRTQRKLEEDLGVMEHELLLEVAGTLEPEHLQDLQRALENPRLALPIAKLSLNSTTDTSSRLRLAVKGCHPGLAAHLCEIGKLELLGLRRIRLGRVLLGDLGPGQWRYLGPHERF